MAIDTREESEAILSLSTPWAPLTPSVADATIGVDDSQILLATLAYSDDTSGAEPEATKVKRRVIILGRSSARPRIRWRH